MKRLTNSRMARQTHIGIEQGMVVRRLDGSRPGPPLVWLHGLGETGLCFEAIVGVPPLDQWSHLIPDLPGYGRSPWPDPPPSLDQLADQLCDWIAELDAPAVLLGHSMGGVLAIQMTERHPERVAAVIDIEGNKSLDDCTYSQNASAVPFDQFLSERLPQLAERVYTLGQGDPAQRGYYIGLRLGDPRAYYRHSQDLVEISETETLAARLVTLPVPTAYIAGSPAGAAARSLEMLRAAGANLIDISPSGHWPFFDQPQAFAEAVATLLTDAQAPA